MMRSYRAFAVRELRAQRVTSALLLFAVILSTMMTAVIGCSVGVLRAMRLNQAVAIGGDRYVTFLQMSEEAADMLKEDPRLSFAGRWVSLGTTELNASLNLGLNEYQEDVTEVYPMRSALKEGRLPEEPMEIALPEDVLGYLDLAGKPGETIPLSVSKALRHGRETSSYEFAADFVLVGVLKSNYLNYTGGAVNGIVGEGTARALLPENYYFCNVDIRTADKKDFQSTVDDLAKAFAVHELDVMYNTPYLDALGIRYHDSGEMFSSAEGFSFMTAAGILVGALFLAAAGMVIYNILKIDVSRKIAQYGVLRAIGAGKGQLQFLVSSQILILALLGIPAGLFLGAISAKSILNAATGLLSPDIFLVQDAQELNRLIAENSAGKGVYLLGSAGITLFFAFAAAVPAGAYAARVSPVVAMAGMGVKVRRRKRAARRIRNFERYYAALNLRRNRGRTVLTLLSLTMSIAVFVALQGSVSLLDTAGGVSEHTGDYSIVNETVGFTPEDLRALQEDEEVSSVAAFQLTLYDSDGSGKPVGTEIGFAMHPGETFQVIGMNDSYMDARLADCLLGEDLERLKAGEGCVVRNPLPLEFEGQELPRTELHAGERISVAGKELAVLHTLDGYERYFSVGNNGFANGVQVIVNQELYTTLTGKEAYNEFLPALRKNADRERFDDTVEALAKRVPGTTWLSYEETDRQAEESFEQIRLLAWGLILFVGLIGLLNIVNTVYTNIHTRVVEIGIQHAVGMSVESLYKVFLWEGAYYGLIAAGAGAAAGYICLLFVEAGTAGGLRLIAFPVLPVAEATVLSVGTCLLATCVPLKKIGRMSIVEAVEKNVVG